MFANTVYSLALLGGVIVAKSLPEPSAVRRPTGPMIATAAVVSPIAQGCSMAGDWIRIRVCLIDDPRVIRMTDYLAYERAFMNWLTAPVQIECDDCAYEHITRNALRCVTVTGLIKVWGVANDIGKVSGDDLLLDHTTLDTIDAISGLPCFGAAMQFVGWANESTKNSVTLPNFLSYNDPANSEKRLGNRERQKRFRDKQRGNSNALHNALHNALPNGHVTRYRREEKSIRESGAGASQTPEAKQTADVGTPFDSLDDPLVTTDSRADPRSGQLYDAVSMFKRWPTEADMLKWRKLADEALGEARVITLLRDGHKAGNTLHKILMAAWELASQEGKASVKATAPKPDGNYERNQKILREVAERDAAKAEAAAREAEAGR